MASETIEEKEKEEDSKTAIYVGDEFRIRRLDKYCLVLEQYSKVYKKNNKEEYSYKWNIIGYHGDMINAFVQLQKVIISNSLLEQDIKGVEEIIKYLKDIKEEIINIIKNSKYKNF